MGEPFHVFLFLLKTNFIIIPFFPPFHTLHFSSFVALVAMLALALLRTQFPTGVSMLPVILVHQIYSIVDDRTEVDRALNELTRTNKVRRFQFIDLGKRNSDALVGPLCPSTGSRGRGFPLIFMFVLNCLFETTDTEMAFCVLATRCFLRTTSLK